LRTALPAALALAVAAGPARADEAVDVKGFFGGFALGVGGTSCRGCESQRGAAVDLRLGHGFTQRFAVVLDASAIAGTESGTGTTTSTLVGFLFQLWPAPRLWLAAGPGVGTSAEPFGLDTEREVKVALVAAAGLQLVQRPKLVLDLRGRYGTYETAASRRHDVGVLLGLTWY
jgi:hypothetical protein